jgi:hypothetical protein
MDNMFEYATRNKLRFDTTVGFITAEDLWDLPLTSTRKVTTLDQVARDINRDLKGETEESFVVTSSNQKKKLLENKLDIVKHIIQVKLAEAEATRSRAARSEEKKKLLEILAEKETQNLVSMDEVDIRKRLAELDA